MTVVACYCPAYYQSHQQNYVTVEGTIVKNKQNLMELTIEKCEMEKDCVEKGSRFCLLHKTIASNRWETTK